MIITATQLAQNTSEYLDLAKIQDVYITKNGQKTAKLVDWYGEKEKSIASKLRGIIKGNTMTLREAKEERLAKKYGV